MRKSCKTVTLADVAAAAGVSKTAASMALFGGAKTIKVSQKTIDRIRSAAAELNYVPNRVARSLTSGKTHSIGIMFGGMRDFFHMELAMDIQQLLITHGYIGIFVAWDDDKRFDASLRSIVAQGVDGIITAHDEGKFPENIPLVMFKSEHNRYDYVKLNKQKRIKLSVDYLVSLGHRDIGFVHGAPRQFIETMKTHSLTVNEKWLLPSDGYSESGVIAGKHFSRLTRKPTAIIARNDMVAMALMAELQQNGVMVPNDISVIGYNNIMVAEHVTPRLTTFDVQLRMTAELLVETMIMRLQKPQAPQIKHEVDIKLIVRDSCTQLSR